VILTPHCAVLHLSREEAGLATPKTTHSSGATDDAQALADYISAADAAELALKREKAAAAEGHWLQVGVAWHQHQHAVLMEYV
jgi:hypothetical protein